MTANSSMLPMNFLNEHGEVIVTPEIDKRYMDSSGVECPWCHESEGAVEMVQNSFQQDADWSWCDCRCDDCGASWQEMYGLKGISLLKPGKLLESR